MSDSSHVVKKISVISVVGTRPNFMKMAPVINSLNKFGIQHMLIHTGQHFDVNMSKVFFDDLKMPLPDIFLGVGSGTHAEITARIMVAFEKICSSEKPKLVIVAGDVNSTLGCALAAVKLNIPVAHVEAGLRSFDNTMPEEINRILTDRIADFLFITEKSGNDNLINEGASKENIHFVGNCMIDSVKKFLPTALEKKPWIKYDLHPKDYCLITMHRPSNVDSVEDLNKLIYILNEMSKKIKVVFPIHPRTKNSLQNSNKKLQDNIMLLEPLPYLDFLGIMSNAKVVVTDSGGIQEETTYLDVQCITVRENTERPITVESGTNHLVGTNPEGVLTVFYEILNGRTKKRKIPTKWDGKSGERIVRIINKFLQ